MLKSSAILMTRAIAELTHIRRMVQVARAVQRQSQLVAHAEYCTTQLTLSFLQTEFMTRSSFTEYYKFE